MNRIVITATIFLMSGTWSHAGECHHFFAAPVVQHHAQAVVAPVVYPQIYYQAGANIEAEAIAEKAALRALAKFTAYQQQTARSHAVATPPPVPAAKPSGVFDFSSGKFTPSPDYAGPAPPPPPPIPADESRNIVAEKCGKCHSGAAPKAGLTIDGATPMPCASVLESLRQIKDDAMPKGGGLSPEEKGLLMEALLALEAK